MSDPQAQTELCDEIGRSLNSVRQRHSGGRKSTISTQIRGDVIECAITEAAAEPAADGEADTETVIFDSLDSAAYHADARIAIAKLTHRRVVSYIPKRDKATGVLTEKFILDRIRKTY